MGGYMASCQETRQKAFDRKLKESYDKLQTMGDKAGFVYVAVHDVWPQYSKIGCTKDPIQRIKTYSTYDPVDCYKLVVYKLVDNMREYEKEIHTFLSDLRMNSEWFNLAWTTAAGIIHAESYEQKAYILTKALSSSRLGTYRKRDYLPANRKMCKLTRQHSYSVSPAA